MPSFNSFTKELQLKVRLLEKLANEKGKEHYETKKLWRELGNDTTACFALNKKNGEYSCCHRRVVEGRSRCEFHGGKTTRGEERTEAQKLAERNLRPDANFIHGFYAKKDDSWIDSLSDSEIAFMNDLADKIHNAYDIPDDGLSQLALEMILIDAVTYFRMVRAGTFERGSKHTINPLERALKVAREYNWVPKEQAKSSNNKVLEKWLDKLED